MIFEHYLRSLIFLRNNRNEFPVEDLKGFNKFSQVLCFDRIDSSENFLNLKIDFLSNDFIDWVTEGIAYEKQLQNIINVFAYLQMGLYHVYSHVGFLALKIANHFRQITRKLQCPNSDSFINWAWNDKTVILGQFHTPHFSLMFFKYFYKSEFLSVPSKNTALEIAWENKPPTRADWQTQNFVLKLTLELAKHFSLSRFPFDNDFVSSARIKEFLLRIQNDWRNPFIVLSFKDFSLLVAFDAPFDDLAISSCTYYLLKAFRNTNVLYSSQMPIVELTKTLTSLRRPNNDSFVCTGRNESLASKKNLQRENHIQMALLELEFNFHV